MRREQKSSPNRYQRSPRAAIVLLCCAIWLAGCAAGPKSAMRGTKTAPTAEKEYLSFDAEQAQKLPAINLMIGALPGWNLSNEISEKSRSISLFAPTDQRSARIYGVKHSPGDPSRLDRLLETELQEWRIRFRQEHWFSKERIQWDSLEAVFFEIGGETEEGALQACGLGAWDGEDYYFITMAHEGGESREELKQEWERLAHFSVTRLKKVSPPVVRTDFSQPVLTVASKRLGYSIIVPDSGWFDWAEIRTMMGDPEFALVNREENLTAVLFAHHLEEELARPSQIFDAYLLQLGIDVAQDEVMVKRRKLAESVIDLRFQASRVVQGIDISYRGRFAWDGQRALMIVGWSQGSLEAKHRPRLERLIQALQLSSVEEDVLDAREKSSTALMLNQIGLIQLQQGDPLSALGYFEKANKLDPTEPLYLINCGFVYQLKKLHGPGIQHFESQMALVKSHGKLLSILGELYEASYNYARALECYTEASQFYPDDEELRINLSDALWGVGYRKQSLEVVESLYRLRPSTRLGVYLAKTYMGLDRYAEATDLLLQLNGARAHSKEMGRVLAEALLAQGRYQEALQVAAHTVARFGDEHQLLMVQGKAQFYLKQFKPALQSFRLAKKLDDSDEENISFLAATQSLLGTGDNKALRKEIAPVHAPRTPQEMLQKSFEKRAHLEAYPALIHFREEAVDFSKEQPWKITEEILVEVLNASGLALFREFSFTYLPGYDRLYINLLRVYRSDFSLKWEGKISDYYVTSEVGDGATSEHQIAHLPVKELEPGDLIQIQVTRASIDKAHWPPFVDHRASRYLPVGFDRLTVSGDLLAMQIEEYGPVERSEKKGSITWEAKEPIILQQELYKPHYQDIAGGVLISGARDWTSVGVEYEALIKHQKRGSIAARELAYEIKGSRHDPQEIIDRVVERVRQSIIYKNVPFGGHAVVPSSSGETLQRRWGDCKDKSLLAHELLTTLGVPNHLVLVNIKEPVSSALPTIHQFDHMILYIPGGKGYREQFVDLTELGGARRPVPYGLEGGVALIIDGDSSRLAIMPMVESALEHKVKISHRVQLRNDGSAEFRDQLELHGKFAAGMREKFSELSDKDLHTTVQAWLDDELPGSTLLDIQLQNMEQFEKPFEILLTFVVQKMLTQESENRAFVQPAPWERIFMRMPRSGKRIHPVRLPNHHDFEWSLSLSAPTGWRVNAIEQSSPAQTNYIDWRSSTSSEKFPIELRAQWSTHAVFATPDEYIQLQKEWESVLDAVTPTIHLISSP